MEMNNGHTDYLNGVFDDILDHVIIRKNPYEWENSSYGMMQYILSNSYKLPTCDYTATDMLNRLDTFCCLINYDDVVQDYGTNRCFVPSKSNSKFYMGISILDSSFLYPSQLYFGTNNMVMKKGNVDIYVTVNGKHISDPHKYFADKKGKHYFVAGHYPMKNNKYGKTHEWYNLVEVSSIYSDDDNSIKNEILRMQKTVLELIIQKPILILSPSQFLSYNEDCEGGQEEMLVNKVFLENHKANYEKRLEEVLNDMKEAGIR